MSHRLGDQMISVQPDWCRALSVQQQSVLFLAARGPDGVAKASPVKSLVRAYRGTVLVAARLGRTLNWGERADSFMSLDRLGDDTAWANDVTTFFDYVDQLPHHYVMHLAHGAQIVGYKHPDARFRLRWCGFYFQVCEDLHLRPEGEAAMDRRLDDWGREGWTA